VAMARIPRPAAAALAAPATQSRPVGTMAAQTTEGWCRSNRVTLGGGALQTLLMDPNVLPFERLWRILPEEGMFHPNVSPERPFVVEIGAFKPANKMSLLVFDLRPDIYRLSGIDAGDYVPVESRRFNAVLGWDVTVDGRRAYTDMEFQLDPVAAPVAGASAFQPDPGSSDFFSSVDTLQVSRFGSTAGAGNALQPNRTHRPGSPSIPYTIYARPNQVVQVRLVVFRPIPSPIAFVEYSIQGIYVPNQTLNAILECVKTIADIPR
jgi:hypothetical protein